MFHFRMNRVTKNMVSIKLMIQIAMMMFFSAVLFAGELEDQLFDAVEKGDTKKAQELINKGANINAKDSFGTTPLLWAISNKQTEAVNLLVKKGANVKAKDLMGMTSLHWAAATDNLLVAKLLIGKGADVKAKNNKMQTPYDLAESDEMKALLKKGKK